MHSYLKVTDDNYHSMRIFSLYPHLFFCAANDALEDNTTSFNNLFGNK